MIRQRRLPLVTLPLVAAVFSGLIEAAPDRTVVEAAMKKASTYFRSEVAVHGGYVYFYSPDLKRRLGEGVASPTEIWVQPPATPTVGMAYLEAWKATGDAFYLEAARETGEALVYGQLQSGGWRNSIEFDPRGERVDQYRNGRGRGKNFSTLDDGISQSALRMLILLDEALEFEAKSVHEAAEYGLKSLLDAQFANGAFPQGWNGPVDSSLPSRAANYPDYDWKTEGRIKEYWNLYNLNDDIAGAVADTLLAAHRVYGEPRYLEALRKLGDFLLLAQMPDPQPGWVQQYNYDMQPVWARRFEPPAIAGRESQEVMMTLVKVAAATGDRKYLAPVVSGVKYLEKSLLPDGQLARYYELETNRPLYMNRRGKEYFLTYDDSNLPSHYGWKTASILEEIKGAYRQVAAGTPVPEPVIPPPDLARLTGEILTALDEEGRWLSTYDGERLIGQAKFQPGESYLSSEVFSGNLRMLSKFLGSAR